MGNQPVPGEAPELIASAAGPMVRFADAMALLANAGIRVAPWEAVAPDVPAAEVAEMASRIGPRVVVKLANVPHRTELDAVRVDVAVEDVEHAITDFAIASGHEVDATVAIQAMVSGHAEAFAGVHCGSGLGDVLLFGRGGVLVELTDGVAGRFLPIDAGVRAAELAGEVAGPEVIAGSSRAATMAARVGGRRDLWSRPSLANAPSLDELAGREPIDRHRGRARRRRRAFLGDRLKDVI